MKKQIIAIIIVVTGVFLWLPVSVYASSQCKPLNDRGVAALFDRWNNSLKSKDPKKVAANYADDAILLPTLSNKPRTNHAEIIDYFVHFLQSNPQGKIDWRVTKHGPDWATDVGLYTFRLIKNGKKSYVTARYSFVYGCVNGQWLIVQQHSSLMPQNEAN